ncbi:MAG: biotin carboxylase N-terminal domain-containing protein [Gaiellales bacterium]
MAIRSVLIANRGEIAARIARTCRELGIEAIAVQAPDDRGAFHTRAADRVVDVVSYLDADAIAQAAADAGADAVHPGYGFLSERADAAAAVIAAGVRWIGPPVDVLRRTGDKLEAKAIAAAAGVPVLPQGEPDAVGYPLLLKAAAGGGGRGMRIVRDPAELDEARLAAAREAEAAFGDGRIYAERLVERPHHVEIQLLADEHGGVLALGERDCSIQRRHQKVLEESPSPVIDDDLRARLADAAIAFARAAGYVGAGTAEFLVADGAIWFLELNARIQVEHPVTESVFGVDLVAAQIAIAEGGRVPAPTVAQGHAIEVRVYAEDPIAFLPRAGTIRRLTLPDGIRVDAGIAEGDGVPVAYDPMIAKLIAHAPTRAEALAALAAALADTEVAGVETNLPFLRWLVRQPDVVAGTATTAFLDEQPPLSTRRRPSGPFAGAWRQRPAHGTGRLPVPQVPERTQGGGPGDGRLIAPMPGVLLALDVAPGDRVAVGDAIGVLEAMKMEHRLVAQCDGLVTEVAASVGGFVDAGALIAAIEPDA